MPKRLSIVDIALVIVLVALAAIAFLLFQAKSDAKAEVAGLETRLKAVKLDIADADKAIEVATANLTEKEADLAQKEANLAEVEAKVAAILQQVEQARPLLNENPFPSRADAVAATYKIMDYAEENSITIAEWYSSYTSLSLISSKYSAIKHTVTAEGKADRLIDFIDALYNASPTPLVQKIDMAEDTEKEGKWSLNLELAVAYR